MNSAGPEAALIERFWHVTLPLMSIVFALTMAALAYASWHARGKNPPLAESRVHVALTAVLGVTAVVLFGYLIADLFVDRALAQPMHARAAVTLKVTGHQWWWEVEYEDSVPARRVLTANEIHIPVGEPVHIDLASADVIHSLWVPVLQGKKDLVPQRPTDVWIQADSAGVYEGHCAEFCGGPHGQMNFQVVAEPPEKYRAWYDAQLQPSQTPLDTLAQRGLVVFGSKPCALCHTIRGTAAGSRAGPDLTHLMSRRRIAAGELPNTKGHLAGWILDPQSSKPGAQMPTNPLTPAELEAVLAYLGTLK
jgi:cytochrome c oxidase subunit 2